SGSRTADFPEEYRELLEKQLPGFAGYMGKELGLRGIVGADIVVVDEGDRTRLYFIEPISRIGVGALSQLLANKFGQHWTKNRENIYMSRTNRVFPFDIHSVDAIVDFMDLADYNPFKIMPSDPEYNPEFGSMVVIEEKTSYIRLPLIHRVTDRQSKHSPLSVRAIHGFAQPSAKVMGYSIDAKSEEEAVRIWRRQDLLFEQALARYDA
ncbi:MAG: hypothetical protein KDD62_12345, partial [Bdellovibrionales bacterium]|nr:hypothetical protein [Bdellovibrionales bacterium]